MTCLLTWASICLLSPQNAYLTAEVISDIAADKYEGRYCTDHFCRGPQGELRIGMTVDISNSLELDYGLMHRSFIRESGASHDRGQESVFLRVMWRPFRE